MFSEMWILSKYSRQGNVTEVKYSLLGVLMKRYSTPLLVGHHRSQFMSIAWSMDGVGTQ